MAIDRTTWRAACFALAAAALAGTSSLAIAQQSARPLTGARLHAGTLEVPLNKSQVVNTDRAIAKAMIGNDEIADILPITDRSVYVLGKKMGTTSLTLYDGAGRVITVMDVAVGPDVEALGEQLREFLPDGQIQARMSNESIVLTGLVNDAGSVDRAMQLAKTFAGDKVVNMISLGSSQQVMLEVRFAEVSRSTSKDIGVKLSATSRDSSFNGLSGAGSQFSPGGTVTNGTATNVISDIFNLGATTSGFGIFAKRFGIGATNFNAVLNAMETRGLAKTLAQPTLVAISGERASFLAGGEFPVPVAQSGAGTGNSNSITVEFKPFGISLGFTPTVLGDRTIHMIVEPEVSAIDPSASFSLGNLTIPGLRTRRASTTIELRDGESFAIAGLLSKDFQTTVDQIPLLGSIPILGALFRSTSFKKGETELLIVVTPHLVAPLSPGQVRLPTDRVKDPSEAETFLLGQPYHPQELPPIAVPITPPVSQAAPTGAANPLAASELPPKKVDDYAY